MSPERWRRRLQPSLCPSYLRRRRLNFLSGAIKRRRSAGHQQQFIVPRRRGPGCPPPPHAYRCLPATSERNMKKGGLGEMVMSQQYSFPLCLGSVSEPSEGGGDVQLQKRTSGGMGPTLPAFESFASLNGGPVGPAELINLQ